MRNHARYGCVLAPVGLASGSQFLAYADWHDSVSEPQLPTGKNEVLYRRSWFPQDLELEAALAVAPTHDDLRLSWFTARQGVPA